MLALPLTQAGANLNGLSNGTTQMITHLHEQCIALRNV